MKTRNYKNQNIYENNLWNQFMTQKVILAVQNKQVTEWREITLSQRVTHQCVVIDLNLPHYCPSSAKETLLQDLLIIQKRMLDRDL